MSSPCPIKDCPRDAKDGHLMCLTHWRMVPDAIQSRVYATWKERLGNPRSEAAREAHERAKADAVEAVEVALGIRKSARKGPASSRAPVFNRRNPGGAHHG